MRILYEDFLCKVVSGQLLTNSITVHKVECWENKVDGIALNATTNQSVTVNNQQLEEVNGLTYLGSKVSTVGDSGKDVSQDYRRQSQAFGFLNPVWKSTKLNMRIKLRIFKSNVLLNRTVCWKRHGSFKET